jgi:hypothetical protein
MKSYYVVYTFPDVDSGYLREFLMGGVRYTYDIEEAKLFQSWEDAMTFLTPHISRMVANGVADAPSRFAIHHFDEELVEAFTQKAV